MTEYEILSLANQAESSRFELLNMAFDSMWSQIQWWAGVSFGLLAVTYFAGKRLKLIQVVALSVLYAAFTLYAASNVSVVLTWVAGHSSELVALRDAGNLSAGGAMVLDRIEAGGRLIPVSSSVSMFGLFFGTLAYLWGVYLKERRSPSSS